MSYDPRRWSDEDGDEPEICDGGHTHVDKTGVVHRCYHSCKNTLTSGAFWLGVTLSYPLEHFLWENVPPFNYIAQYFGLLH